MIAQQVNFEGRVQGVGFRFTVKELARGYDVFGWIRNLPDGRVEMHIQGEPGEVEAFVNEIQLSALRPFIARHTKREVALDKDLKGFQIR